MYVRPVTMKEWSAQGRMCHSSAWQDGVVPKQAEASCGRRLIIGALACGLGALLFMLLLMYALHLPLQLDWHMAGPCVGQAGGWPSLVNN